MQVIGWNTTKTAAGYQWRVYAIAHAATTKTIVSGISPTRARAVGRAKAWCLHHRKLASRSAK